MSSENEIKALAKESQTTASPITGKGVDNEIQNGPINIWDWLATMPRIAEAIASVIANSAGSPTLLDGGDHGNNAFDRAMFHITTDSSGKTTLHPAASGITLVSAAVGIGLLIGVIQRIYKSKHAEHLNSPKRLRAALARHRVCTDEEAEAYLALEKEQDEALAEFITQLQRIHKKVEKNIGITRAEIEKIDALNEIISKDNPIKSIIKNAEDDYNQAQNVYAISKPLNEKTFSIKRINGSVFSKQPSTAANDVDANNTTERKENSFLRIIRKVHNHRYFKRLSYPFDWMVNQSMWYWIGWFCALMIVGPLLVYGGAATIAIAAVSLLVGGVISAIKYRDTRKIQGNNNIHRADIIKLLNNRNDESIKDQVFKDSIQAMIEYYREKPDYKKLKNIEKQAAFLFRKYKKHKAADNAKADRLLKAWQSRTFMNFEHDQNMQKIETIRNEAGIANNEPIQAGDIPNSRAHQSVRDYLLQDQKRYKIERGFYFASKILSAVAFGFVIPFFITQLLGGLLSAAFAATLGYIGHAAFTITGGVIHFASAKYSIVNTIVNVVSSNTAYCIPAATWGGLWAIKNMFAAIASHKHDKLGFQSQSDRILKTEYSPGVTKEAKFNTLQQQLDSKIAYLKSSNPALYSTVKTKLVGFDQWSATNFHYHEKQREKATLWTWAKKGLNRAFEFIGGGETGILVVRLLFLAVFVTAGAVGTISTLGIGAPIFISLCVAFGSLLGVNRLLKYQLNKRQEHRQNFLDTFDDRLKFLEQKNEELDKLLGVAPVETIDRPPPQSDERDVTPTTTPASTITPPVNKMGHGGTSSSSSADAPFANEEEKAPETAAPAPTTEAASTWKHADKASVQNSQTLFASHGVIKTAEVKTPTLNIKVVPVYSSNSPGLFRKSSEAEKSAIPVSTLKPGTAAI